MIIAIDVDDVCAKLTETWLEKYNSHYKDNLKESDITAWNTSQFVKPECGQLIYSYLKDKSLYDNVRPVEGALDGVNELRKWGHRVVFATATPMESAGRKFGWLEDNGFAPKEADYVELYDKSLICADILFDDKYDNAMKFRGMGILLTKPWNADLPFAYRVPDWDTFLRIAKIKGS